MHSQTGTYRETVRRRQSGTALAVGGFLALPTGAVLMQMLTQPPWCITGAWLAVMGVVCMVMGGILRQPPRIMRESNEKALEQAPGGIVRRLRRGSSIR